MTAVRTFVRSNVRNPNAIAYVLMAVVALFFPAVVQFASGGSGDYLVGLAADGGVYMLMAIGLNVVVGFAGLLDLGYAAFFAIGSYTYALVASNHLGVTPIGHSLHVPFWLALFIGMFVAAGAGSLPGWFVGPWVGKDFGWVSGFKFTSANLTAYYVLMVVLITFVVILVNNLHGSRLGRAWMAVREDETAAAASGVNTVSIKLLAFSIGAATSGFAGAFYGAKLSYVSSENFGFIVSVTVLAMVVLGGMGNIPGAMLGGIVLYFILFWLLPNAPLQMQNLASSLGLDWLNQTNPNGWPGISEVVSRSKYVIFGLILVGIMLLRPQGLLPSQIRKQELRHEEHEAIAAPRQLQG